MELFFNPGNTLSFANTTQEGNQGAAIRKYATGTGYSAGEHAARSQELRLPLGSHSQHTQNNVFPSIGNTFLGHGDRLLSELSPSAFNEFLIYFDYLK
ncbi:hypothetical protein [uncultured Akkermansia sp.]|uniref:hypothetical protein n=1 Tax=uncultured Akkermansia sp. TaxID=512294 RepID=UPI0026285727|nr:hypothetical protein [uncultured Akkermansia sp.]